jgi:hypothetical protein
VLSDDQRAREEFNFVLANDPPPAVRANVDRFLTSMRLRESTYRLTAGGFVETGYGYDTNANGGVGSAIITLPGFGVVTVNEDGVHQDTPYRWLAAGGRISKPLAPGFTAIANARMDSKFHSRATQFDQRNASADAGLSYLKNKNLYRAVVSYSQLSVDDDRYRDVGDASIEWLRQINEFAAVQLLAQYGVLRYTGANETRNADVAAIGVGYRKAFIMRWQPQVSVNVLGGRERNAEDRPDLGRRIGGANATLSLAPAPRWTVATIASYQGSRYRAEDALTLTQRKDDYYAINVVTQYAWTRQVILGTELLLARNDSNLDLFQYERGLLTLKVRYEFR